MNSRGICLCVCLLPGMAWSCQGRPERSLPPSLVAFRKAVDSQVIPLSASLDYKEVQRRIGLLAKQFLVPNKDVLHQEARKRLSELPKYDPAIAKDLADELSSDEKKDLESVVAVFKRGIETPDGPMGVRPEEPELCLALGMWDPALVARLCWATALMRILGPGRYSTLQQALVYAPPTVKVVDGNTEQPTLVVLSGRSAFITSLRYSPEGIYLPTELRCLGTIVKHGQQGRVQPGNAAGRPKPGVR